jgi:hypothetical protein
LIAGFKARSGGRLLRFDVSTATPKARDSGSEQRIGLFDPSGKIEH